MKTSEIKIGGMTCGGCVASVKKALQAVPGVVDVAVTLAPGSAQVQYEEGQTSEADLRAAIEDAGYDVG